MSKIRSIIFILLCLSVIIQTPGLAQINLNKEKSDSHNDSHDHDMESDTFFFAYAKSNKANVLSNIEEEANDHRYAVVQGVLDKLIMAKGDKRLQRPKLIVSDKTRYVAYMNSRTIEIGIEKKAYDLCASLGKDSLNALAVLLGHEIIHYYEKHNWTNNFAKKNLAMETGQTLKKIAKIEGLPNETQADYLGGFLGYSAGFNTLGMMPKVLKILYKGYGLPDTIPGYPTLAERELIANNSMDLLEELMHIYDMGNYLTVIGDYENARILYKRVLKDFQSRELFNNVGVISFLEALQLFKEEEVQYGYPIELDVTSRLNNPATRGFSEDKMRRESLLRDAIANFDQATTLDNEYAVGYLNRACAHSLLGEIEEAEFYINKSRKLAKAQNLKVTTADLLILEGIIADQSNDRPMSKAKFEESVTMGSELAKTNLMILNGESLPVQIEKPMGFGTSSERIDDIILKNFINSQFDADATIEIERDYKLYVVHNAASKIYIAHNEDSGAHSSVLITNEDYSGSTINGGIRIGDESAKVSDPSSFGPPSRTLGTNRGRFMIYPKWKMIFALTGEERVERWGIFNIHVPE